jgi:hypothetical protein
MTPDYSYGRIGFNFKSPAKGIVDDRDFHMLQITKRDFPEKGDYAFIHKSLPDNPECPHVRGRVRAHAHMISLIYKRIIVNGEEHTDVFMVSCIDIKGSFPKFLVNNCSSSAPRENFENFERAAIAWKEGKFFKQFGQ